eukprot:CAMPEP_0181533712 /NCGR_PEP_ID=MMETSP1110-20121109/73302_1 /TAXON_ID=174948 /ORGANISM="Symbiodinium sp., Strain CCMP421" /LENGTH=38 /DNA_ID= /DNA_START= /DNA_END= /DNA_ORIENTATION=
MKDFPSTVDAEESAKYPAPISTEALGLGDAWLRPMLPA